MSSSSPSQRTGPGISPQATIHKEAFISGSHPISIGANAVIQLRAKISSTHGPVTVGEGCVVYERAVVGAVLSSQPIVISAAADSTTTSTSSRDILGREARAVELSPLPLKEPEEVVLEKGVVVESGATVEAGSRLGEGTVVEVGARVGRGAVLGKVCTTTTPLCINFFLFFLFFLLIYFLFSLSIHLSSYGLFHGMLS